MKEILLADGRFTRVSDQDWIWLAGYNWSVSGDGYVHARVDGHNQKMHLMVAARMRINGQEVDHHDRNKLNNQRDNLRPATTSQNRRNRTPKGTAGVRLVGNRYRAYSWDGNKQIHLGYFDTEQEAADAHADFIITNYPEFGVTSGKS